EDAVACKERGGQEGARRSFRRTHERIILNGFPQRQPAAQGGFAMPARAAATVVCSLLFVGVVLTSARGAEPAPDPLVTKLQDRLDHLTSLQGEFVQTLSSSGLGRTRTESGRFWIRKPNLMRW